ncbi:MAG: tellurite resistance TerB family protein [Loktanella sp.]|jgi:uncharacterized membrane protein YebE (DUF533 family)|nr:tellurite resistance TerB family protein [Loktanella sp.]MDO7624503.1 tellurite resistance TerB family protein [Loktanella sp.]MDO7626602.1 tellurite resistance TerB family protein [Loktanella sp.]MDO7684925.1 tellurite resistance TerB family protein [Loktanella sp.]MDO7706264.1 tellurite resistance TerB family protein [Loktanella sp.]
MSLMKTLAKVAIGVAVAKGVASMTQKAGQQQAGQQDNDGLFRGQHSPNAGQKPDLGGLENMMDNILGDGQQQQTRTGQTGGIGGLLEGLAGGGQQQQTQQSSGGGLNDILGQLGGTGGAGGLGGLLGGLVKQMQAGQQTNQGSFGDVLNSQFDGNPTQAIQPSAEQEAVAGLMIRAMVQAAKSDGKLDDAERQKLLARLGEVSADEQRFVQDELNAPVDVEGLARQTPRGLEQQIYTMSVMGIDLDTQQEAQYLHQFATALGLPQAQVNAIHAKLGVPAIYR